MISFLSSYQYGGKVPANLACLHASFAHYCPKQDQYEVKVLYATDIKEAAHLIRRVVEVTYKASKVGGGVQRCEK